MSIHGWVRTLLGGISFGCFAFLTPLFALVRDQEDEAPTDGHDASPNRVHPPITEVVLAQGGETGDSTRESGKTTLPA